MVSFNTKINKLKREIEASGIPYYDKRYAYPVGIRVRKYETSYYVSPERASGASTKVYNEMITNLTSYFSKIEKMANKLGLETKRHKIPREIEIPIKGR